MQMAADGGVECPVPGRTRIKVCCIASEAEARLATSLGADALGLVSAMPSGPGPIPEELIAAIAAGVAPPVATFLLTSLTRVDDIVRQHARCRTTTVQLVDELTHGTIADLRQALPGIGIVQVIHVTGPESVAQAMTASHDVHALLLDSGNPTARVKELGGTGRVHDWMLARRIRDASAVPLFLAGGLRPENVTAALETVRPWGVDLCSGVRTEGRLDPRRLAEFIGRVAAWDRSRAGNASG